MNLKKIVLFVITLLVWVMFISACVMLVTTPLVKWTLLEVAVGLVIVATLRNTITELL